MSIPVFEHCGHKIRDISRSKAQHWLRTKPEVIEKVEGYLEHGLQLDRCLRYIAIPYENLAVTLAATQAPTRRRIHPWLERETAEAIIAAQLAIPTDNDHQLALTAKGQTVLQHTYAKLLHQDLDRGIELMGTLVSVLRDAVREAGPVLDAHESRSWKDTLQAAWDETTDIPAPYDVFRDQLADVPARMMKFLVHIEPHTAERLLQTPL